MKKILLTLTSIACISVASAGTTTSILNLTGTVSSSCNSTLSSSTLNFQFVPGQQSTPQSTDLQLSCSAGTTLQNLAAQSSNGWEFSGTTTGSKIPYTLTNLGINSPYASSAGNFATTWSGATGSSTAQTVLNSPVTIDAQADTLAMNLAVAPAITPASAAVDNYSDTITFTATY